MDEITATPAYQKCVRDRGAVKVPKFDFRLGFVLAYDSAKRREIEYLEHDSLGEQITRSMRMPEDENLFQAIHAILARAQKYFKDKP